ncbi:MAG: oxygenase MpaB family protein [Halobacteria archaeon]
MEKHLGVEGDIRELKESVRDPSAGFFGPDSVTWKVDRENALLLGGVGALLLQIAHPKVAAGVDDHSEFRESPSQRFRRTFDIVDDIIFGDTKMAITASRDVREIHDDVVGEMEIQTSNFEEGESYDANDPDLLLWVFSTLIDQALVSYETYVGELTDDEKRRYYQEHKKFGLLMGIPRGRFPDTLDDFYRYYQDTLEDLTVSKRALELKETLFRQYRVFGGVYGVLANVTLPEKIREGYEIELNPVEAEVSRRFPEFAKKSIQRLPPEIRYKKCYHQGLKRIESRKQYNETASRVNERIHSPVSDLRYRLVKLSPLLCDPREPRSLSVLPNIWNPGKRGKLSLDQLFVEENLLKLTSAYLLVTQ